MIGFKECRRCRETKPVDQFSLQRRSRGDGRHSYCKPCATDAHRDWVAANPERVKAYARSVQLAKYGITQDDYERLLEEQGGRCAICRAESSRDPRYLPLYVDHDHASGVVRGLLCSCCNFGIGQFLDDPALLMAAAKYLAGVANEIPAHVPVSTTK